jgi:hypothetical protein
VLAPPGSERLLDAPVGSLYVHGIAGGLLGLLLSGLLVLFAVEMLERTGADLDFGVAVVGWLSWQGVPGLFVVGAALGLARRGKALGLGGSTGRAMLGGVAVLALGMCLVPVAGELALVGAALISPLAAARFGLGLFRPWWPWRRLVGLSAVVLLAGAAGTYLDSEHAGRILLDQSGGSVVVASGGTAVLLEGLQPPVRLASLSEDVVGIAWRAGQGRIALRAGRFVTLRDSPLRPAGPPGPWSVAVRLGDRLLVVGQGGLFSVPWTRPEERPELLWSEADARPLAIQLGAMAHEALVPLEGGDLLDVLADGSAHRIRASLPPSSAWVALATRGSRLCVAQGRHVLCREGLESPWTEASAGLQGAAITGFCALGDGLAVASDRGLFVGDGTPASPFRLVAAGRFDTIQAAECGAVAVGGASLTTLDAAGRPSTRSWTDG